MCAGSSEVRRRVVLCDASPLIFLAKLDRLELIALVTKRPLVVVEAVVREVLSDRAGPVEHQRLERWISRVEVVQQEGAAFASDALSESDRSSLAWAVENRAEWLLADERLLRRFAQTYGIKVIGFCGILVQAAKQGHVSAEEARDCVDRAIRDHRCRLSVDVYRRILTELEGLSHGDAE